MTHITATVIEATIGHRISSSCAKGVTTCAITTNQEFHGNLGYAAFCTRRYNVPVVLESNAGLSRSMVLMHKRDEFESAIFELTKPLNGQFPRPWMTALGDPLSARVFIVGRNQRNGYYTSQLSHRRHLDALFNRNGETCRNVYDEMTGGAPSRTRTNTDRFRAILESEGVSDLLETNVICYSTPMSSDLKLRVHAAGAVRGSEIFRSILDFIAPRVLIAHGAGTHNDLAKVLGTTLPRPRFQMGPPVSTDVGGILVYVIPSLAPPEWNKWSSWAPAHLTAVAKEVARALS